LGQKVIVTTRVDEQLIGGLEVRIGDTIYDGSVAGSLKALRTSAADHAARAVSRALDPVDARN
jgi:F-type H+-transporting ATPase subunit delta